MKLFQSYLDIYLVCALKTLTLQYTPAVKLPYKSMDGTCTYCARMFLTVLLWQINLNAMFLVKGKSISKEKTLL